MDFPKPKDTKFELVPAGPHVARLFRLICKGTQQSEYPKGSGQFKGKYKISLAWELPNCLTTPTEDFPEARPMQVHGNFTRTLSDQGLLRPILDAWVGHEVNMKEAEAKGYFDLEGLIGKAGYLSVVHSDPDSNGTVWANVKTCQPLPPGADCPEPFNEPKILMLDDKGEGGDVFDSLSDKMRETIMKSPEWKMWNSNRPEGRTDEQLDKELDGAMEPGPVGDTPPPIEDEDDQAPF